MAEEVWKAVPGWPTYEVSDQGRVRSSRGVLRHDICSNGRARVTLCVRGYKRRYSVHRLVLLTFVGEPPAGQEVRHLNGDHTNNSLSNLRYGTRSENRRDRIAHGTDYQAIKTHCDHGHPFTPENTYLVPEHLSGVRACRECGKLHARRKRAARRNLTAAPTPFPTPQGETP